MVRRNRQRAAKPSAIIRVTAEVSVSSRWVLVASLSVPVVMQALVHFR